MGNLRIRTPGSERSRHRLPLQREAGSLHQIRSSKKKESVPDISRIYLKTTPKVKASVTNEEAAPPQKRKKGKASSKVAPDIGSSIMKVEIDYDPIQDYGGSEDPGVAELDDIRTISDSLSEDGQESDQQEY